MATRPLILALTLCLMAWSACAELTDVEPRPAPELRLPDLSGGMQDLEALRGEIVVLNFWASWCIPCMEEMPSLQRLADQMHGERFRVIGVNVGEGKLRVKAAVRRLGIRFPVLLDGDSAAFEGWGAVVLPSTYVIDAGGFTRYLGRGPLQWDGDDILELLAGLAADGPGTGDAN